MCKYLLLFYLVEKYLVKIKIHGNFVGFGITTSSNQFNIWPIKKVSKKSQKVVLHDLLSYF